MSLTKRDFFVAFGTVLVLVVVFLLGYLQSPLFGRKKLLDSQFLEKLERLGTQSLENRDVPVASLLLYGTDVLGEGFNTVVRDSDAAGHAEVNAIRSAIKKIGIEAFAELNRDSLRLISTFEPCIMCKGAILEYRIRHVVYLKEKPLAHVLKEDFRLLLYHWQKVKQEPGSIQDSLFHRHRSYRP